MSDDAGFDGDSFDDGGLGLDLGIGDHHDADDGGHHDQGGLHDKTLNDLLLLGALTGNGPLKQLGKRTPPQRRGAGCGCALPAMALAAVALASILLA